MAPGGIEAPPPQYSQGPYSAQHMYVNNPDQDCKTLMNSHTSKHMQGCYVPLLNMIILPATCDPKTGKIGRTCIQLDRHEEGHARGWRHDDGMVPNWINPK